MDIKFEWLRAGDNAPEVLRLISQEAASLTNRAAQVSPTLKEHAARRHAARQTIQLVMAAIDVAEAQTISAGRIRCGIDQNRWKLIVTVVPSDVPEGGDFTVRAVSDLTAILWDFMTDEPLGATQQALSREYEDVLAHNPVTPQELTANLDRLRKKLGEPGSTVTIRAQLLDAMANCTSQDDFEQRLAALQKANPHFLFRRGKTAEEVNNAAWKRGGANAVDDSPVPLTNELDALVAEAVG